MAKLTTEDRNQLTRILESLPQLQTYEDRFELLRSAGLDKLIPFINLEGKPFVVVGKILDQLEAYGRLSYEHDSLGLFLNRTKDFIGAADNNHQFLDDVLKRYSLMTPAKAQEDIAEWQGKVDFQNVLEKVIGENTLRHISFLKRGIEVSRAVALVDVAEWVGTGFMVSPNILMTNNHVLPNTTKLSQTVFRFNYQLTFDGAEEKVRVYRALPSGLFSSKEDLDYTLVELEGTPGSDWSIAPLSSALPNKRDRVNIIQHPAGQPKQISFQNNFVEYVGSNVIQYVTSTLAGSSGSPVFDDEWQVIGVHHAGGMLTEPGTNRRYFRNEGIAIGAILNSLPAEIRARLGT